MELAEVCFTVSYFLTLSDDIRYLLHVLYSFCYSVLHQGQNRYWMIFFYFDAAVLILTSIIYLILELIQLIGRVRSYPKEIENYVQVVLFISVIIFAFPMGQNSCWCLPGWKWQIGALAVFFAWINLLLLIRYVPWLKVGERSTMLFNVYQNFIKSLYLPIIILVTFAIPIYMIFVDIVPPEVRQFCVELNWSKSYLF